MTVLQEDMIGLLEPINSRITDPRYYLTTPHQGKPETKSHLQRMRRVSRVSKAGGCLTRGEMLREHS